MWKHQKELAFVVKNRLLLLSCAQPLFLFPSFF